MGCDIHPCIEIKGDYDYWDAVAIPDHTRCYPFFAGMANVRTGYGKQDLPEIGAIQGLPPDMDADSKKLVDGDHTHRWFNLTEAEAYDKRLDAMDFGENPDDWYPMIQWKRWLKTMRFFAELYNRPGDRVRVVYNFDS